jgi:23S rRNA G2445 N2-methylase RlmL
MLVSNVFPNFRVPNAIEAALFSFEVAPEHLFELVGNKLPFGCHAWEKYNKSFWKTQLDLPHEL